MDLGEVGWGDVRWIGLEIVNAVMTLRVPYNSGKFLIGFTTGGV
jgi:hypothetical protein